MKTIAQFQEKDKTARNIVENLHPNKHDDYNLSILKSSWVLVEMGIENAVYYSQSGSGSCFFEYAPNQRLMIDTKLQNTVENWKL